MQRLKNIAKEETTLHELLEQAQTERFKTNKLSSYEYEQITSEYKERLNTLDKIRIHLRNKKISVLRTQQAIENLDNEEKELLELIKETQYQYFEKNTIGKQRFTELQKAQQQRLSQIIEQKELLKNVSAKESKTKQYRCLQAVQFIIAKLEILFEKIKIQYTLIKGELFHKQNNTQNKTTSTSAENRTKRGGNEKQ